MLNLIIGILILVFTAIVLTISVKRTPINLRGFYGAMFAILSIAGFLGGGYLVVNGILQLL